jgi:hypothetical protein
MSVVENTEFSSVLVSLPDQVKRRQSLTSACSNKSIGYPSSGHTADAVCSSMGHVAVQFQPIQSCKG